jgi:chromosome segregation ATPase
MLNDLTSSQIQYDELMVRINNDSLRIKLEREQVRTQQLLEELEHIKSTSATEITRLKKELRTVRAVLKNYVIQIDSLNRENETLKKENASVRNKYKEASKKISNLAEEKQALSEKVTLASQLDATNVNITLLRKNGKATKNIKQAKQIEITFTITKNITAESGEKIAYVRIMQPDQEVLTKSSSDTFVYENRNIGYSMSRRFEYTGESHEMTLYWNIEETLKEGEYNAYIFVDGNMIGSGKAIFGE